MKKSTALYIAFCSAIFLLFFHPTLAFNARAIVDDQCYLQWLSRFLHFSYDRCPQPYTFPGTALLWLPGAAIAKFLAVLTHTPVLSAITVSIGLTAFLCWGLSLFLFRRLMLSYGVGEKEANGLAPLFLLAIPILHYATVRTTMAHTAELALCLLTLVMVREKRWVAALFFAAWLTATRINDVPVLLVLLGSFIDEHRQHLREKRRQLILFALGALLLALPVVHVAFISRYGGLGLIPLLRGINLHEFRYLLVGDDFGLLFTGTFWLGMLVAGTVTWPRLSWAARGGLIWMWFLMVIYMGWGGMGNAFGYRYLIGTYPAALLVFIEWRTRSVWRSRLGYGLLTLNALWITHLTWVYDHFSSATEVLRHRHGWLAFKQLFHPVIRWAQFSAPAIATKWLLGKPESALGYHGEFDAQLSHAQITATLWVTALALALLVFSLHRAHRRHPLRRR